MALTRLGFLIMIVCVLCNAAQASDEPADADGARGDEIGACCAGPDAEFYEPFTCIGDLTEAECGSLPEEDTIWTLDESCEAIPPFECDLPPYCEIEFRTCGDRTECVPGPEPHDWIMNVTFSTINHDSGAEPCVLGYSDYTDHVAYVSHGQTYLLSVTPCGEGWREECVTAWIDWNQDRILDNDVERYDVGCDTNETLSTSITVPPSAVPGYTRMRIITRYGDPIYNPCYRRTLGGAEDYTVKIETDYPLGACCNPETGICTDNVLGPDCLPPMQFSMEEECFDAFPECGDPGACCDPYTGICSEGILASQCLPPMQASAGESCADAFPNCGNPGACCDDFTGDCNEGVLELSCDGTRFAPAPATCSDFEHGCGDIYASFRLGVGTEPPPAMLCGWYFTSFPDDPRPTGMSVSNVPWVPPHDDHWIEFDPPLSHRMIGDGWTSWSHGYTGDVYYSNGATEVTLTMPSIATNFYFYVQPDPFEEHTFKMIVDGWIESEEFTAHGDAGATFAGVCVDLNRIETLTIVCTSGAAFAIGEFGGGWAPSNFGACCDPVTGECADEVDVSECNPPLVFHCWQYCDDLNPPCGDGGACCIDAEPYCIEDVIEAECEGTYLGRGTVCGHDCDDDGQPDACQPSYTDAGLFLTHLLAATPDPVYVCMFDANGDGVLDGRDIQGFVLRLIP